MSGPVTEPPPSCGGSTRLAAAQPGNHAPQGRVAVDELVLEDWQNVEPAPDGLSFSLAAWRGLGHARQALVLRHWLARNGLRAPTEARLADRDMKLKHGSAWITCVRGRVNLILKKQ